MKKVVHLLLVVGIIGGFFYNASGPNARLTGLPKKTMDHVRFLNEALAYHKALVEEANYQGADKGMHRPTPPMDPKVPLEDLITQAKELETSLKADSGKNKKQLEACTELIKTLSIIKKAHTAVKIKDVDTFNSLVPKANKQIEKFTAKIESL